MPRAGVLYVGTSQEVDVALAGLAESLLMFADKVEKFVPRSNETAAVAKLVMRSAHEVSRLRGAALSHADLAAWSMRNLFEIWIILSSVVGNPDHMRRWIGQTIADEVQVLEATRLWFADMPERLLMLEEGIKNLRRVCENLGLDPEARQFSIEKLANALNCLDEYKVMFKLSSKFVHPSAALVNGRLDANDPELTNMFLVRSQEYARHMLAEAERWFELLSTTTSGDVI